MTLPTTGSISLTDVMNEIRIANPSRAYPISLGDADVLALAGKVAPPISISDLYGKSSYVPMVITGNSDSGSAITDGHSGTVSCNPSVSVANGKGAKSYLWSFTSNPGSCSLSNATSSTCTVSHAYATNSTGEAAATLQCVVTDDITSVTKNGIGADLIWDV